MKSPSIISVYECIYENEEIVEEKLLNVSRLNPEGKVTQRERYDKEGNLIKKEAYQYEGELVMVTIEEDLVEKSINKTVCTYQGDKLVNQKEYLDDALTIEMVYNYNEEGELTQNDALNDDGSLRSRYTYEYVGLKTIESFFDEEMALVRRTETTKDENEAVIAKKITEIYDNREEVNEQKIEHKIVDGEYIKNYYNNGTEAYEVVECYDEEGRVIENVLFDVAKDEESVTTIEYDENGNVVKEKIEVNDEEVSMTNVVFDEYGNRVELVKKSKLADDFFETSTYKFVNEYEVDEEA